MSKNNENLFKIKGIELILKNLDNLDAGKNHSLKETPKEHRNTRNTRVISSNKESFWICMPRGPGIRRHCEELWQEAEQLIFILAGTE